jgi:hypothetical protein
MTINNFCFYLQNRLIQTTQTGGQWYSDTSPFSIPTRVVKKFEYYNAIGALLMNRLILGFIISARAFPRNEGFQSCGHSKHKPIR